MTSSSWTEDDGAAVAPLTFWAAMADIKLEEMSPKRLCVDRTNKLCAQSATLKLALGKFNAPQFSPEHFCKSQDCMIPSIPALARLLPGQR